MDNVLIDDRRIHVDFSQSVAKNFQWKKQGKSDYEHFLQIHFSIMCIFAHMIEMIVCTCSFGYYLEFNCYEFIKNVVKQHT